MRRLLRSWRRRVAVAGHSMAPTLRDGDWLLVDADAASRLGDVVAAHDPRDRSRLLVKRIVEVDGAGRLLLGSDSPEHAGQRFGPLEQADIIGRAWLRYWPPRRLGRVG